MNNNPVNPYQEQPQEEALDIKALFFKFFRYWYFFAITIFVTLVIAFLFNKYTRPIYEVSSTVLVQDKKSGMLDAQSLIGLGFGNNQQNLQNEIGILNSHALVVTAIKTLPFEVSYFAEDNFITTELYKKSPFTIVMDTSHPQPVNIKMQVTILNNKQYKLEVEGENAVLYDFSALKPLERDSKPVVVESLKLKQTYSFGEEIVNDNYKFKVLLNYNYIGEKHNDKKFYFTLNDLNSLVNQFKGYKIEPINREASIVQIKLQGNNIEKSVDFLNALTNSYLERGLDKKNRIAIKTIEFIDKELIGIKDSLTLAESRLEEFRKESSIMSLDMEAQQVFEYMKDLDKQKAELLVKAKYY
ncbi:MAG TPA: Wzz/FepE/Etk N-terminal domain-containing protein, partial [Bacteroidales bacterium]|nr:Wzz/FepE/Etk N-terminal domain-containing protein [Bacteroidales bacterium]